MEMWFWGKMLRILWKAKKVVGQKDEKMRGCRYRSNNKKGGFRTPSGHRKAERKAIHERESSRDGEKEGEKEGERERGESLADTQRHRERERERERETDI